MIASPSPMPPEIVFSGDPPLGALDENREMISLVRLVLDDAGVGVGEPAVDTIMLEAMGGGRSGAHIFKVKLATSSDRGSRGPSAVVKISPLAEGTCERANFDQFARAHLPLAYRPDLLGYAEMGDHSALCYSFVGGSERPESLSDRLAAGDLAALEYVFSSLVETLWQSWYGSHLIEAETDLSRYYLDRYFENMAAATRAEEALFAYASRFFNAEHGRQRCSIGGTAFPSVSGVLFSCKDERAYRSCILHGDLNSDNVILGRDRRPALLVDFHRTGRGHVFQDLVSLEASVRINYPSNAPLCDIVETERLIAFGDPRTCMDPYATAICGIRDAARRFYRFGETPSNYQFAVAAVGLRLMRAEDLSDAALARITASTLWSARALLEL